MMNVDFIRLKILTLGSSDGEQANGWSSFAIGGTIREFTRQILRKKGFWEFCWGDQEEPFKSGFITIKGDILWDVSFTI
jgi:hypothetical protein